MDSYKSILPYLKNKAAGSAYIFLRKDCRQLFNEDARLVADELLMSDVAIKNFQLDNDQELTVLSLNKSQYNRVIRDLLLIVRCRVEVYQESDDGKGFELQMKGDLSNYEDFNEILESCVELGELSSIMSIRLHGKDSSDDNNVSIVLCNLRDMRITVAEFSDTPNFYYLSECIQNTVPRECLVYKSDAETRPEGYKNLTICLNRSNVPRIESRLSSDEVEKKKSNFISLLFRPSQGFKEPSLSKNILEAAAPLFRHLRLLPNFEGKFFLVEYKSAGHLHLDSAAVRALELFALVQDDDDAPVRGVGTLYDHVNRCRSESGRKLLRTWMRRPLSDLRRINERLDAVEALIESHSQRSVLWDSLLRQVPDINVIERRMLQKKANLHDCYKLYRVVELLKKFDSVLLDLYDEHSDAKSAAVKALLHGPVKECIKDLNAFAKVIDEFVDIDYADEHDEYRIKPAKSEELSQCWREMQKLERKANTLHQNAINRTGIDSIKMDKLSEGGFSFRAGLKDDKALEKAGFEVSAVKKGTGITFGTRELSALSEEYSEVYQNYSRLQEEMISQVLEVAQENISKLQRMNEVLSVIDVLVSFSIVAASSSTGYVRPELLEKGTGVFELNQCRHPVIEEKNDIQYIANDVSLHYKKTNDKVNGPRFAIVTGANMGGKSTYLRSAGLTVTLAQMGCFVPCSSAKFSIFEGIFTRVGASDFQCNGVSTFMAEMIDCVAMLDAAKSTSLILVDELGRGTSTYDGFGMAYAIASHILNRIGAFCLFATHYHEMSLLKEKFPEDVINLKVETYSNTSGDIALLYKIVEGLAERSFGINIAVSVGFPRHIIEDAKRILNYLETNSWENADEIDPTEPTKEVSEEKMAAVEDMISKVKALNIQNPNELRRKILELIPEKI